MGARLVSDVLMRWASCVPDKAFRALVRMAQTAKDEPTDDVPAALYFGGIELIISVLPFEPGTSHESRARAAKRAVADLVAMGAIERTNKAMAGIRQVYRLTLDKTPRPLEKKPNRRFDIDEPPVDNPVGTPEQGDTVSPPLGDNGSHPVGDTVSPKRGTPRVPPRNHKEPPQEKREEEGVFAADLSPSARARLETELEFIPPKQCGHPGCVRGWILPVDPRAPNRPCPKCSGAQVIPFPERKSA